MNDEHPVWWHRLVLVEAIFYDERIGELVDRDSIEQLVDDLIDAVKDEKEMK